MTYGINDQLNFERNIYGILNPGLELYHDFYAYYVVQLQDLARGLIPYKDFAYSYGPLFLYSLYPFFRLGGATLASAPILVTDAATASIIYLVVRRMASEKLAIVAGLAYAVSPFALLYEGYLWFSSQPMTLFILLSLFFLFEKKPVYASIALAVAILFKQEAFFVFPIFLVWQLREFKLDLRKSLSVFLSILIAVSLPFVLISSSGYAMSLTYGLFGSIGVPSIPTGGSGPSLPPIATNQTLTCSQMINNTMNSICTYGNFVYTSSQHNVPFWQLLLQPDFLNDISYWILIPLLGISCFLIIKSKNDPARYLVASAYLGLGFNLVFGLLVHTIFRYYLLPVYVLFLAGSTNRTSVAASIIFALISLVLPSGPFQLIPPVFIGLAVLLSKSNQKWSANQYIRDGRPIQTATS